MNWNLIIDDDEEDQEDSIYDEADDKWQQEKDFRVKNWLESLGL